MARGAGDLRCDAHAGTRSTRRFMGVGHGPGGRDAVQGGLGAMARAPRPARPAGRGRLCGVRPARGRARRTLLRHRRHLRLRPRPRCQRPTGRASRRRWAWGSRSRRTSCAETATKARTTALGCRGARAPYRRRGTSSAGAWWGCVSAWGWGGGRPILNFNGRGFEWFVPGPVRVNGVSISMDALIGLVVRAGPVRPRPGVGGEHALAARRGGVHHLRRGRPLHHARAADRHGLQLLRGRPAAPARAGEHRDARAPPGPPAGCEPTLRPGREPPRRLTRVKGASALGRRPETT
jgi:hypothetical protein